MSMLIDPENPSEEWAEEIRAKSLEQARVICQELAGDNQPTPPQADGVWKTFCSRMPDSDCNPQASPQSGGEYIPYSIQFYEA